MSNKHSVNRPIRNDATALIDDDVTSCLALDCDMGEMGDHDLDLAMIDCERALQGMSDERNIYQASN